MLQICAKTFVYPCGGVIQIRYAALGNVQRIRRVEKIELVFPAVPFMPLGEAAAGLLHDVVDIV